MNKISFKGSIVIVDPCYFIKSEEDFELCSNNGENVSDPDLSKLGFTDYLCFEFPDDPQIVVDQSSKKIIGGICQDSCLMAVVYKSELQKYNHDYDEGFDLSANNITIIENFIGDVEYKTVPVTIDGYTEHDTVIIGTGNINFRSCYEEDLS